MSQASTSGKRKRRRTDATHEASALEAAAPSAQPCSTIPDETWSPTVAFAFLYSLVRQISPEAQPSMPVPEHDAAAPEVQVCTRAYEDTFLFEPGMHERPCVNGRTHCESVAMGGPVLKEFLLPSDAPAAASTRPCLLCMRTAIAQAHFQASTQQHGSQHIILQRHCNVIGGAGEYAPEACLVPASCATGLVAPIVLHTRSSLKAKTVDGVRGWTQLYATPTHTTDACHDNSHESFLARLAV